MSKPVVTVITVCRNALQDLLRTEASVRGQTCAEMEWIIVDGGSDDGTREHLQSLGESWVKWISEPDEGIYDAMNKGICMAGGEWLWFLNAGDVFHDGTVIGQVLKARPATAICFGEALIEDGKGHILGTRSEVTPHRLPERLERQAFRKGMVVSHQAFVVRREIAPFFDAGRYRFSADLDWMLRILKEPRPSERLGVLARMPRTGASRDNWGKSQRERFHVLCRHFGTLPTLAAHVSILLRRAIFLIRTGRLR